MSTHEFLSPTWIEAALALHAEYAARLPESPVAVRMNLIVTNAPHHEEGRLDASVDTAEHGLLPRLGHLSEPELTVTLGYEDAKALFVAQDPEAVGQAFFAGKIRIEGDMSRLFLLQAQQPDEAAKVLVDEVNARLQALTA